MLPSVLPAPSGFHAAGNVRSALERPRLPTPPITSGDGRTTDGLLILTNQLSREHTAAAFAGQCEFFFSHLTRNVPIVHLSQAGPRGPVISMALIGAFNV